MCFAPQLRALFQHPNLQKWREHVVFCTFWLGNVLRATTACTFSTSEPPKVVRDRQFLTLLTWKCASRHNGVHFFNISTSKSGPKLRCFVHFDLEMCFAPQRRALFQHLNFQKWSEAEVFCTFWLGNVLRATTACTFSTSQLPKVVREWCVLYILTWKCASRHNGVQFFISHLASWLRTRRFSEPTFRPSGATNHWKNTVFRDFPTFSRIWIFCLLTLSLLIFLFSMPLPCSAFHLSILSEVWLLNFLRLCIHGGLLKSGYPQIISHPQAPWLRRLHWFGVWPPPPPAAAAVATHPTRSWLRWALEPPCARFPPWPRWLNHVGKKRWGRYRKMMKKCIFGEKKYMGMCGKLEWKNS